MGLKQGCKDGEAPSTEGLATEGLEAGPMEVGAGGSSINVTRVDVGLPPCAAVEAVVAADGARPPRGGSAGPPRPCPHQ